MLLNIFVMKFEDVEKGNAIKIEEINFKAVFFIWHVVYHIFKLMMLGFYIVKKF